MIRERPSFVVARPPEVRARLHELAEQNGRGTLAAASRLLGHNPGYLARFVREGIPERLSDRDAEILVRFFGVRPNELGVKRR